MPLLAIVDARTPLTLLAEIGIALYDGAIAALFMFTVTLLGFGLFEEPIVHVDDVRSYVSEQLGIPQGSSWEEISGEAERSTRNRVTKQFELDSDALWPDVTRAQEDSWPSLLQIDQG